MTDTRSLLSAAALLLVLALSPAAAGAQEGGVGLPLGAPVPPAGLQDLDGAPVQLLDVIGGRPALIEIWATWCPLCRELEPRIQRIHARWGDEIRIVAVAVAVNQNPRRIRRWLEDHDAPWPHLYDADGEAVRALRAATTSIVLLVGADGKVAYTGVGADQDLEAAVDALLEQDPPFPDRLDRGLQHRYGETGRPARPTASATHRTHDLELHPRPRGPERHPHPR